MGSFLAFTVFLTIYFDIYVSHTIHILIINTPTNKST